MLDEGLIMKNCYFILGIDRNASEQEIKKAFRKLAHQHHPDKEGGDEEIMKNLNQAREEALRFCNNQVDIPSSSYTSSSSMQEYSFSQCVNCGEDSYEYYEFCLNCIIEIAREKKRKRTHNMRSKLICLNCKKSLYHRPLNTKYCDVKCSKEYNKKIKNTVAKCVNCSKVLKTKGMKYCDRLCRRSYREDMSQLSEREFEDVLKRRKR